MLHSLCVFTVISTPCYLQHVNTCCLLHVAHAPGARWGMLTWRNGLWLQMLAVAEQAFLAFLEDAQEAFDIMTQHAARRRAMRNQALKVSNSSGHPSSCIGSHDGEEAAGSRGSSGGDADTNRGTSARSPPLVFTPAHVDFITQLADVMARLPRGSAGQPLYAIAASISSRLSATQ